MEIKEQVKKAERIMNYSIIANDMIEIFSNGLDYSLLNNKTIMITGAYGMIARSGDGIYQGDSN